MSKIIVTVSKRGRTQVIYEDTKSVREIVTIRRGTDVMVSSGRAFYAQRPTDRVVVVEKPVKLGRRMVVRHTTEKAKASFRKEAKPRRRNRAVATAPAPCTVKEEDPLGPDGTQALTGADFERIDEVLGQYIEAAGIEVVENLPVLNDEELDAILGE